MCEDRRRDLLQQSKPLFLGFGCIFRGDRGEQIRAFAVLSMDFVRALILIWRKSRFSSAVFRCPAQCGHKGRVVLDPRASPGIHQHRCATWPMGAAQGKPTAAADPAPAPAPAASAASTDLPKLEDLYDLSLQGASTYILPRIALSSGAASIYGASIGYYIGDAMVLNFYSYGATFGILGTTFFTGNYILRGLRGTDDCYNFGLSGGMSGGAVGALKGARRGAMGVVAGGVFGVAYKLSSDWLYMTSRESWIQTR
jgi:hypothetical protein